MIGRFAGLGVLLCIGAGVNGLCAAPIETDDVEPVPDPALRANSSGVDQPTAQQPQVTDEEVNEQSSAEFDAADAAFEKENYGECLTHLQAAVKKNPLLPPAEVMLAKRYWQAGDMRQARSLLEQLAHRQPSPDAHEALGDLAMADGHLSDALLQYREALSRLNDAVPAANQSRITIECYGGMASIHERRGDWALVISALRELTKRLPNVASIHDRLGAAYFMDGQEDQALAAFEAAHSLDSQQNVPEASMAAMALRAGQSRSKVTAWYDKAIQQHPENARIVDQFAMTHLGWNDADQAAVLAEKAAAIDNHDPQLRLHRGMIEFSLGRFEDAEQHFLSVHKAFPENSAAKAHLALSLIEQDDDQKRQSALRLAQENTSKHPQSSDALALEGLIYYQLGDLPEAEAALNKAVQFGRLSLMGLYAYARVLRDLGREDEAARAIAALKALSASAEFFALAPAVKKWVKTATTEGAHDVIPAP